MSRPTRAPAILAVIAALILGVALGVDPPAEAASSGGGPGQVGRMAEPPRGESLTVRTRDGRYQGRSRGDHLEWLGVRYGQAPVGRLRFAPPRAARPFSGVRSATRAAASCPQVTPILPGPLGQQNSSAEDCLFLNVYRPSGEAPAGGFPVMVFIPGGAYILGDGSGYDPTPLVEQGRVIAVTLNYRLGPLGFLTLPGTDRESRTHTSGDWAILDQQLALRWVRRNVAAFGGDRSRTTLFGESAGGNSVCQQLTSPGSRGLFQQAIVQSGACVGSRLGPFSAARTRHNSVAFARSMGCTRPGRYLPCLRGKSAKALVAGPTTQFGSLEVTWAPTVDGHVLPTSPEQAVRQGRWPRIPLLMGSNRDEGTLFTTLFYHVKGNPVSEQFYRDYLRRTFPGHAAEVLRRYPSSRYGSPSLALSATTTDPQFACPSLWTAQLARRDASRLWTYELDDPQPPTLIPDPFLMDQGDYHSADLAFLMDTVQMIPMNRTPQQEQESQEMVGYWTAFAATGDPNSGGGRPAWAQRAAGDGGRMFTLTSLGSRPRTGFADYHQCDLWGRLRPPR